MKTIQCTLMKSLNIPIRTITLIKVAHVMNGASGHDSALVRLYWEGTTWANEMNLL